MQKTLKFLMALSLAISLMVGGVSQVMAGPNDGPVEDSASDSEEVILLMIIEPDV